MIPTFESNTLFCIYKTGYIIIVEQGLVRLKSTYRVIIVFLSMSLQDVARRAEFFKIKTNSVLLLFQCMLQV